MTLANHLCTAAILALMVSRTTGGALIDQQYVPATTNSHGIVGATAQTFTVGANGILVGFDMWVTRHENVSEPLLFDIRRAQSGVPVNADSGPDILASGVLPADLIGISKPFDPPPGLSIGSRFIDLDGPHLAPDALVHIDLSDTRFSVFQGEVLAIVLRSDEPNLFRGFTYVWHGHSPGEYQGGAGAFRSTADHKWYALENVGSLSSDHAFRTYVQPITEPRTAMLLIAGVLMVLNHTFKKRSRYTSLGPLI
jgi:hypothetical protein